MKLDVITSLIVIFLVALTTFLTRVLPFVLFPAHKKTPKTVLYLGSVLPPAVIGLLVVYCLKTICFISVPFGLPELIAVFSVIVLHCLKRNNLISIFGGTFLYMFLIQFVFI